MSWLDTLEEIRTRDYSTATKEEQERVSREVINICSYAAAVAAVSPLPFSDALLTLHRGAGLELPDFLQLVTATVAAALDLEQGHEDRDHPGDARRHEQVPPGPVRFHASRQAQARDACKAEV